MRKPMRKDSLKQYSSPEYLNMLMERILEVEKTFETVASPIGKRTHAITLLCEIEYVLYRIHRICSHWIHHYPLDINRDELVRYISLFDVKKESSLYQNATNYFDNEECYDCCYDDRNIGKMRFEDLVFHKQEIRRTRPGFGFIESADNKFINLLYELTEDERKEVSGLVRKFNKINGTVFERIFGCKTEEILYPRLYCRLMDEYDYEDQFSINRYIDFLLKICDEDLRDIIRLKYILIYCNLRVFLNLIDDPHSSAYCDIYKNAHQLFENNNPEEAAKKRQWKKWNENKNDYPERIKHRKNEIRKLVEEYGWGMEWQDLFVLSEDSIIPNEVYIGSFIHAHLKEMQTDDFKLLHIFMGLLNDWLFYTQEEILLLDDNNESNCTSEEKASIREDLNFVVPKKEECPVNQKSIIVYGDFVLDKKVENQVNYVEHGGTGVTTK